MARKILLVLFAVTAVLDAVLLALRHSMNSLIALGFSIFWFAVVFRRSEVRFDRGMVVPVVFALIVGCAVCFTFLNVMNPRFW